MGKLLMEQPKEQFAEPVRQPHPFVRIVADALDVAVEADALHPVHQQHGKLPVGRLVRVYEEFLFEILRRHQIGRRDVWQVLADLAISLFAPLLLFDEALDGIILLAVRHLEHDCEVATAHNGLASCIQHRHEIRELVEIVFRIQNRFSIF